MPEPTMTHEPHCNDRCIHYLAGESVSGVAPDVPHREPVGRNSPSQGGVTDSPAPEPGADAAWEAKVFVREAFRRYWLPDADEARCVEIALGGLRAAALARPTPALDVEALAEAMDRADPGLDDGYEEWDRAEHREYAAVLAREYATILARATEGGTDR